MFLLSDFSINCKSPVDNNSQTNSSNYNNKVSSQYSPDRKKPFLSNSRLRRHLFKCRKAPVAKLNQETCPEFRDSFLASKRLVFETFHCYLQQYPHYTLDKPVQPVSQYKVMSEADNYTNWWVKLHNYRLVSETTRTSTNCWLRHLHKLVRPCLQYKLVSRQLNNRVRSTKQWD